MTIPRIIHQTWKDPYAHPALAYCMESFRFQNPGWEWRFYTDADCLDWVRERCPHLLPTYLTHGTGIHRADFFRILILYFEGGMYADIDVECLRPLDELISRLPDGKGVYLTRDHPIHERIHFGGRAMWMNDFMIAAAGDPLIGEILKWMMHSPPGTANSANAVMETGPGVISSVIEMLGGPEMIPTLGVIPTPWVHPLPDMNCGFPEKPAYRHQIATRSWLEREVFAVHYWFHTWVTGAETNTLTDYGDVLLSTRGEQVERLLQWELRESSLESDMVIATALAELAEMQGEIEICLGPGQDSFLGAFIDLLMLAQLQPRIRFHCRDATAEASSLRWRLESLGAEVAAAGQPSSGDNVLLVVSGFVGVPEIAEMNGLVLGPSQDHGEVIMRGGGIALTEVWRPEREVPKTLHLFPSDEPYGEAIRLHFAAKGWETRCWTADQLRKLVQEKTLGSVRPLILSARSLETAAGLIILWRQGGAVFRGDSVAAANALAPMHRPAMLQDGAFWIFACEPRCPLLDGAFEHWLGARQRSRANAPTTAPEKRGLAEHLCADASLAEFLETRLRAMHFTGRAGRLHARRDVSQLSQNETHR